MKDRMYRDGGPESGSAVLVYEGDDDVYERSEGPLDGPQAVGGY